MAKKNNNLSERIFLLSVAGFSALVAFMLARELVVYIRILVGR